MNIPRLSSVLTTATLLSLIVFSGCVGGGGQDPVQDPVAGGSVFNPDVLDGALHVDAKGRVVTRRGESVPGVTITVRADGRPVSEDVSDQNGVYHVRLRRSRENAVRADRAGFDFEPGTIQVTPSRSEVLRDIVALPRPIAIPGAGQQQVDDPVGVGNRPEAIQGHVEVRLMVDPTAGALDALLNVQVVIRDAATNRVIETHRTNNSNSFTYIGSVGKEIIIEPVARDGVRWYPSSRRLRISGGRQEVTFQWRADRAPAARPAPRPFLTPAPRPTPRPALARPSATPAPSRPIWFRPTQ